MTENDRMERARRIRRMREGKRTAEDEDSEDPDESEAAGEDPGAETETDVDDTVSADATGTDVSQAMASVEDAGPAVPSAEEMAATVEEDPVAAERDDSDAAREVAAARAARAAESSEDVAADPTEPGTGPAPAEEQPDAGDGADTGGDDDATSVDASGATETGGARATADHGTDGAEERTRVLEFTLDDEQYCLDISYIEEIVKGEYITRVPNTPEFVEGVVDLRGQITTILNPKVTIGKEDTEPGDLIVVFDGEAFEEQGYVGWIVDDVRQVSPVTDEEVNDPPMAEDYINGVIDREEDDEFVVWTSPDLAFEEA